MSDSLDTLELEPFTEVDDSVLDEIEGHEGTPVVSAAPSRDAENVLQAIQSLNQIRDLDTLLEQVLLRSRQFVRADAGTIYLRSHGRLHFSFVQNDTLFGGKNPAQYSYSANSLPIDHSSLAGYVASTADPLFIDDVYDIQSTVSYSFNPEFDTKSHYRTKSMLIVPLVTRDKSLVGVLQLINAQDDHGETVPFSYQDQLFATQFAQHAADAIERAKLTREMVLGMVELSALRDPFETALHANRVGAMSREIYDRWATRKNVAQDELRANREIIRTAAMLHDVGKSAISDTILRKQDALTEAEFKIMRLHTIYGARLFKRDDSPWHMMAREIALNHHERWDGTGYPGQTSNIFQRRIKLGRPKRGTEIPVAARIVSIAEVFDALVSQRSHKKAWPEQKALDYIQSEASARFDPFLVEVFLGMQDAVRSIRAKYAPGTEQ
jgi:HD-GYP domain-containing protein (c-di-GMP phosphodiesterase class II)